MSSSSRRILARFIGELARAAGVSVYTVRYYERLGLLPTAQRSEAGYRVYSAQAVERLRFIQQAQALGFSLGEIKEILRLRYARQSPCECVRALLSRKLKDVERQMRELHRFRRLLHRTLARSRTLPRLPHEASALCPIIEEASAVAGPRRQRRRRGEGR